MSLIEYLLNIGLYSQLLPFLRSIIILFIGLMLIIKKDISNKTRICFGILLVLTFFFSALITLYVRGIDATTAMFFLFNLLATFVFLIIGIILLAKKELPRKLRIWIGAILLLIFIIPFLIILNIFL